MGLLVAVQVQPRGKTRWAFCGTGPELLGDVASSSLGCKRFSFIAGLFGRICFLPHSLPLQLHSIVHRGLEVGQCCLAAAGVSRVSRAVSSCPMLWPSSSSSTNKAVPSEEAEKFCRTLQQRGSQQSISSL